MIPYILALAGGYLLGNATESKFAEGGAIFGVTDMGVRYRYTKFDNPYTGNGYKYVIFGTTFGGYKFNYVTDKILSEKEINSFYIDNVETSSQNADGGMMARGGEIDKSGDWLENLSYEKAKKFAINLSDKKQVDVYIYHYEYDDSYAIDTKKQKINAYPITEIVRKGTKMAGGMMAKGVPSKQELIDLFTKEWQTFGYKKNEAKEFAEQEVAESKFSINKDGFLVQVKPDAAGVLKKQIWQLGKNKLILKDIYEKSTIGVDNKWKLII